MHEVACSLDGDCAGDGGIGGGTLEVARSLDGFGCVGGLGGGTVLPDNFKIGADEFWSMLEANAREVLVLLDGYDGGTDMADVQQILSGTRLRQGTIMVAVNPEMLPNNSFVPDLKLYNMGLNHHHVQRCIKTCMNLTRLDPEENQKL